MSDIIKAKELIKKSKKILFITGAGISTNAGIPDYRSKGGLYETHGGNIFTQEFFNENPKDFYDILRDKLNDKVPTLSHYILSNMCNVKDHLIVTQNIDLLHEKAERRYGNQNNIHHIHGSVKEYHFEEGELPLICEDGEIPSDNILKHLGYPRVGVVLFGETLKWIDNYSIYNSDLIVCIGTSGQVGTVRMLIEAVNDKAPIIVISKGETEMDSYCDIKLDGDCDKILQELY